MSGRWERRGLLLAPPLGPEWAVSHAALPIVDAVCGEGFDVLFTSRDEQGRSRIGRATVAVTDARARVSRVVGEPLLDLGATGAFDDRGVTGACLVHHEGRSFLYYSGWSLGVTVPFYFYVGCAISDDGGRTFRRVSRAPVLERDDIDPYLTASPWILVEDGVWRMWYVSCTGWSDDGRHAYHIKYAESADGIRWRREGRVCVDYAGEGEYAISRPCVVRDDDRYRMWFAARGGAYRLGYAESNDGLVWDRLDRDVALEGGSHGWDDQMTCYPCVFDRGDERWMLYNGNGYGATGTGWAQWVTE